MEFGKQLLLGLAVLSCLSFQASTSTERVKGSHCQDSNRPAIDLDLNSTLPPPEVNETKAWGHLQKVTATINEFRLSLNDTIRRIDSRRYNKKSNLACKARSWKIYSGNETDPLHVLQQVEAFSAWIVDLASRWVALTVTKVSLPGDDPPLQRPPSELVDQVGLYSYCELKKAYQRIHDTHLVEVYYKESSGLTEDAADRRLLENDLSFKLQTVLCHLEILLSYADILYPWKQCGEIRPRKLRKSRNRNKLFAFQCYLLRKADELCVGVEALVHFMYAERVKNGNI